MIYSCKYVDVVSNTSHSLTILITSNEYSTDLLDSGYPVVIWISYFQPELNRRASASERQLFESDRSVIQGARSLVRFVHEFGVGAYWCIWARLVSAVSLGRVTISETVRFDTTRWGWDDGSRLSFVLDNLLHDSEYIGKTLKHELIISLSRSIVTMFIWLL